VHPVTPVHFLVIPKNRDGLTGLSKAEDRHAQLLGHLLVVVSKVAAQEKLDDGYRVVINDGKNAGEFKFLFYVKNLIIIYDIG
jgi:histidine triad (HIT) family protein